MLPRCVLDMAPAKRQEMLDNLRDFFAEKYGMTCLLGLHQSKEELNVHVHILYSERLRLIYPVIKTANRNAFFDEKGIRRRTKKEILDAGGNIRKGCRIIPKGEVISIRHFGDKDPMLSDRYWCHYCKEDLVKWVNDYLHGFVNWLGEDILDHGNCLKYKDELLNRGLKPSTINGMLSALNKFFEAIGRQDCRLKKLRVQRRVFRSTERELTKEEYMKLTETAYSKGKERIALLMETICATGIRVSEVRAITVEAIATCRAEIYLKGKVRTILLPNKLCRKLKKYAKKQKITSGEIFLTRSGKSISRKQIWAEMKAICKAAGVTASKVFPHNLRHLFARAFYKVCRDIVKLADVLGHSSIETTRIYLVSSGYEHSRDLEKLGLIN